MREGCCVGRQSAFDFLSLFCVCVCVCFEVVTALFLRRAIERHELVAFLVLRCIERITCFGENKRCGRDHVLNWLWKVVLESGAGWNKNERWQAR